MPLIQTGYKGWQDLEEVFLDDNTSVGTPTKPNVESDLDYIEPIYDPNSCEVGLEIEEE